MDPYLRQLYRAQKDKYLFINAQKKGSNCVGRATTRWLFTGAIPLLPDTGTFACCVSALGRFIPR